MMVYDKYYFYKIVLAQAILIFCAHVHQSQHSPHLTASFHLKENTPTLRAYSNGGQKSIISNRQYDITSFPVWQPCLQWIQQQKQNLCERV